MVEVTARDFAFDAPDSIPSGWITFRMENAGQQEHFVILGRLPDGKTFEDYEHQIAAPFYRLWGQYEAGDLDKADFKKRFSESAPDWFGSVGVFGGPGLVAPSRTAQTTVQLEPGEYWMECYVNTPEGEWHARRGMVRPLTVTEKSSGAAAPEADLELAVSEGAIQATGTPTAGEQTVAVHYGKRPSDALFMGNDVHLVRLEEGAEIKALARWMDFWKADGFRAPAPGEFLGGAQDMPAGDTAYFTVTLEPGRYAWVMEAPTERSEVKTFTVE